MALNLNQQIIELVNQSHNVLITTSVFDTGDGLASALALKLFLQSMNKPADIVVNPSAKEKLNFLPLANQVKTNLGSLKKFIINLDISKNKVSEFNYDINGDKLKIFITPENGNFNEKDINFGSSDFKYDLIFIINSPDLESLGNLYLENMDFFYNTPIINIDTDAANEHFGQVNLVELNKSSAAEILFNLLKETHSQSLDETMATCLLTGMMIKTNSFRAPHVSPTCLAAASNLIQLGANREYIINQLNKNKNLPTLNLWGRILARLKTDSHYHLAWSLISQTDFQKSGAEAKNLAGVVNELIANSPQIEITLILYETEQDNINGVLYTSPNYNALELSHPFNPQGHRQEANFSLTTTRLIEAEEEVINKLRQRIKPEH